MNARMTAAWLIALALSLGTAGAQQESQGQALPGTLTLPDTMTLPGTSLPDTSLPDAPAAAPVHTVRLDVRSPANSKETVVSVPLGMQKIIVGTSRLGGRLLSEPLVSLRNAYFTLPGGVNGALSFDLQGEGDVQAGGLLVRYPQGSQETLQGTVDLADLALATPNAVETPERSGVIRSPADGLSLRDRHSVDVTLDVPLGRAISGALRVNGALVPDSQIGETSVYRDGHTRLKFIAVPLSTGVNTLTSYGDTVTLTAGGPAAAVTVTPVSPPIADGSTPVTLTLSVVDAGGNLTGLPSLSVTVDGSEPLNPDGSASQSGFQVTLSGGVGTLTLRPLSQPGVVTLHFDVNGHQQTERLDVKGDARRVLIAHAGGTLSGQGATFQGAASIEAPILGGKLYVAASSQGVNTPALPYARFPAYGDASAQSQPLRAQGKLALRLVLPAVHAEYGQDAAQDPVFGVQMGADGLNIETNGTTRFGASLTQVQGDQQTLTLTPDGSRLLRLPASAIPGSETVVFVTSGGGVDVNRRTLQPGRDYVTGGGGLLEFPLPLSPVTQEGQDLRVVVTFRGGIGTSSVGAGVHLTRDFAVKNLSGSVSAGAVLLGGVPSFGAHVTLNGSGGTLDALAGASGGALLGSVTGAYKNGALQGNLSARAEQSGYTGPGAGSPGVTLGLGASYALTPHFGVKVTLSGSQTPGPVTDGTVTGNLNPAETTGTLIAAVGAAYTDDTWKAELLLRRNFGAGLFGVQGLIGARQAGREVTLSHAQDFSSLQSAAGQSLSTLSASVLLTPEVKFGLSVNRDWNTGRTLAGLTLSGSRAGVNYLAGYDLPSEGGSLGRARLSASTSLPISRELSADLSGSLSGSDNGSGKGSSGTPGEGGLQGALGATLRYVDPGTQGSVGADAVLSPAGLKFGVKTGVNVSYGLEWTLGADALSEFGAGDGGNRLGLGLAWRGDNASALAYLRFRNGSFGEDRLSAELDLEQRPDWRDQNQKDQDRKNASTAGTSARFSPWQFRESLALAVPLGGSSATALLTGDARYWVTNRLAFGLGVGALYQSRAPLTARLGLEATIVPLPGWGLTAGYNLFGFQTDLGQTPTRPGFYLKLDLALDEVHR